MRPLCWLPALMLLFPLLVCAGTHPGADLVITNASVITVNGSRQEAEAIAVLHNKIQYVGKNKEARAFIGETTRVINGEGKTVMPGIYDGHVHSYRASISELGGAAPVIHSIAEAQEWIGQQVKTKPAASWIILERVYASRLREQRLPTKGELDLAAPHNPIHWNSGPVSVANSKALELSQITRDTPNPSPGEIVKDPKTGEPTGLLRNAAHLLKGAVSAHRPSPEEHLDALKKLHALYNQHGITSIGERRTDPEAIDLFRRLAASGELTVRVNCTRVMDPVPKTIPEALKKLSEITNAAPGKFSYGPSGTGDEWVRIGPLKVFLDGGMLIGTAYMREPWGISEMFQITDPDYRGLLNVNPDILNPLYLAAAKQGWQLTAHCTGEASPEVLLDCYENIAREVGRERLRERRFLITHANFQTQQSLKRMKRLNIAADIQPAWLYKDGATLLKVLGTDRMKNFQPLRAMFRGGIVIAGGSDHMVQLDADESTNPWNPWLGMWIALTRQTERGGVLNSRERLNREQAIRFYTLNNAYLHHEEKIKGSIEPGKLADVILLDRNILNCKVDEIRETQVRLTVVDGKIVWQRP